MRYTAFQGLGQKWWTWVEDNAPTDFKPSRRKVAKLLGISYQAVADLSYKSCTLDRVYDYMTRMSEHGWPQTRIIVDGAQVELEVVGELTISA